MFIGVLGWLDTPLDLYVYIVFGVLFLAITAISVQRSKAYWVDRGTLPLMFTAVVSTLLTFILELLTWTPYVSETIEGIQGRYFTPILIFLGYSMFARRLSGVQLRWALAIVLVTITFSIEAMIPKLLHRYWTS
jgi:uncharacterized membrane protein